MLSNLCMVTFCATILCVRPAGSRISSTLHMWVGGHVSFADFFDTSEQLLLHLPGEPDCQAADPSSEKGMPPKFKWTTFKVMQVAMPMLPIPLGCYFLYKALKSFNRSPPPIATDSRT
eukprot:4059581-Prymnesium_polylepis.1